MGKELCNLWPTAVNHNRQVAVSHEYPLSQLQELENHLVCRG